MIVSSPKRRNMIEQAMKDRAPKMYQELTRSGKLQQVLEDRDELLMETYHDIFDEASNRIVMKKGKNLIEMEQAQTMLQHEAWENALGTALEFQDETTEEELSMDDH